MPQQSFNRPNEPERESGYPGEKTRQAEIVLRRRWQRWVFFGGLVLAAVLGLVFQFFI